MRRAFALGVVGVALAAPGSARADGEAVTLEAGRSVALHKSAVAFSGRVEPAAEGIRVHLYRRIAGADHVIARVETDAEGRYRIVKTLKNPGPFLARASFPVGGGGSPIVVESGLVQVKIKPRLRARFAGTSVVGHQLLVRGRLKPTDAGVLVKMVRGVARRVAVGRRGAFTIKLSTGVPRTMRVKLRLRPADGHVGRTVKRKRRLALPALSVGSSGPSVLALERLLNAQQYALRGVNGSYSWDTSQAVLAFQKVHGLARTGRVTAALWRRIGNAKTPRARRPRGNHIEISKTHQVLYEVRKGKVVNVLHTSTGATGNTPVGTWRVYSKVPGYNASHMYYSLFFLRGFAIHGYDPVPSWPASHGCARIPIWAAPGLYSRWGYGSRIVIFP